MKVFCLVGFSLELDIFIILNKIKFKLKKREEIIDIISAWRQVTSNLQNGQVTFL